MYSSRASPGEYNARDLSAQTYKQSSGPLFCNYKSLLVITSDADRIEAFSLPLWATTCQHGRYASFPPLYSQNWELDWN